MLFFSLTVQEVRRQAGSIGLIYDSQVPSWSEVDFSFSYAVRLMVILSSISILRVSFEKVISSAFYIFLGFFKSYKWWRSVGI